MFHSKSTGRVSNTRTEISTYGNRQFLAQNSSWIFRFDISIQIYWRFQPAFPLRIRAARKHICMRIGPNLDCPARLQVERALASCGMLWLRWLDQSLHVHTLTISDKYWNLPDKNPNQTSIFGVPTVQRLVFSNLPPKTRMGVPHHCTQYVVSGFSLEEFGFNDGTNHQSVHLVEGHLWTGFSKKKWLWDCGS